MARRYNHFPVGVICSLVSSENSVFIALFLTAPAFQLGGLIQANLLRGCDLKGDLVSKVWVKPKGNGGVY